MRMNQSRYVLSTAASLAFCALTGAAAAASTITVDTADDELGDGGGDCSLREAIEAANLNTAVDGCAAGDDAADTIMIPAGTYVLDVAGANEDGNQTGDLDVLGDLALIGAGAGETIIDGNDADRILQIVSGISVTAQGLTLENGNVVGCEGQQGPGESRGGGIHNAGTLALAAVAVRDNAVTSSCVESNGFAYGGGIYNAGTLTISNAHVEGNTLSAPESSSGAGIYTEGDLTVVDSAVSANTASGEYGAIGGGIFVFNGQVPPTLTVTRSLLSENAAIAAGGIGYEALGGAMASSYSQIPATITLTNCTISGNRAEVMQDGVERLAAGGGVLAATGWTIQATTITGNEAEAGGGIFTFSQLPPEGTGAILRSVIVAGNTAAPYDPQRYGTGGPDIFDRVQSRGFNLIGDASEAVIDTDDTGNTAEGNLIDVDPVLLSLAGNGGPSFTHALADTSPAIDAGACTDVGGAAIAVDQRGMPRPTDGCDIGAFEFIAPDPACGDGMVDADETCDDGNTDNTDACLATCDAASCGDGFVHMGVETCDTSGESATCNANCTAAVCGDTIVNELAGEACDDGNTTAGDGCDAMCQEEILPEDPGLSVSGGGPTCESSVAGKTGAGFGGALFILVTVVAFVCRRRIAALWLAVVVMTASGPALAQNASGQIPVERFHMAVDEGGILNIESGRVAAHQSWDMGVWIGTANDPLIARDRESQDRVGSIVDQRYGGALSAAVGLWGWVELGLQLPLIFTQGGDDIAGLMRGPASGTPSIGDIRILPKVKLVQRSAFAVSVIPGFTVPTATSDDYAGAAGPMFTPRLAVSARTGRVHLGLNLGYRLRENVSLADLVVGDEILLGAGVGVRVGRAKISASFSSATSASDPLGGANTTYMEALAGASYEVTSPIDVFFATGVGLNDGFGAPDWRALVGARYSIDPEKERVAPLPVQVVKVDTDKDGILDDTDECITDPEDLDGFEDRDGCPDNDHDGDGVLAGNDDCPTEPGPEANSGCPDLDRDGDGIVDRLDNCPDEPGTPAQSGCKEKQLAVLTETRIEITERVHFEFDKAVLQSRSHELLDNVAAIIKAHPEITEIQVEGHTDAIGSEAYNQDLAQRRAAAVVDYLVGQGVARDRLTAVGYGESRPTATNDSREGRAQNRRVRFVIVDKKQPAAPADTPDNSPTDTTETPAPASPDEATEPTTDAAEKPAPAPPPEAAEPIL